LEDLANALAGFGGTFEIVLGANLLRDCHTLQVEKMSCNQRELVLERTCLFGSDRSLACFPELLNHSAITSEILLAADKDDRQASAEVHDLRDPLQEARNVV
jgi:hypothetical protein